MFSKVWRWVKWPVIVVVVAYALLVIWDVFRLNDVDKTNAAVVAIHVWRHVREQRGDHLYRGYSGYGDAARDVCPGYQLASEPLCSGPKRGR